MPLWNMCSITALIGAKPVPEATNTIGLSASSRRKKVPIGPSQRRMSRSFILLKTWSVKCPPATCRMCNSMNSASCGAFAMEKLRREPSLSRNSMYCPARNTSFSLAGSFSCSSIESSDRRSNFCTRQGSFLTTMSFAAPMVRASSTRSDSGLAWQKSALPCAFSSSVSVFG